MMESVAQERQHVSERKDIPPEEIDQSKLKPINVSFTYHGHAWTAEVYALDEEDAKYMLQQMAKGYVSDLGFSTSIYAACECRRPCTKCGWVAGYPKN